MDMKAFQKLPFKKKAEHIWEYYRWYILAAVLIVGFLGSWIHSAVTHRDPILQLQMINANMRSPEGEVLEPFLEQEGLEYFEGAVTINRNIQFGSDDGMQDAGSAQMLMCYLAAGEGDVYFWDNRECLQILNGGVLLDLRDILPKETMEAQKENLVYCQNEETGELYPCGIYMEQNPWLLKNEYYVNCSVSIPVTVKNPALAGDLILWLLEQQ